MRVLGIDPGLTRCGVAIVDGRAGSTLTAVHIGVIRTDPLACRSSSGSTGVYAGLSALVDEFEPDAIAIERVFSQHNVRSAMGTAQAAAMGLLLAGQRGLPVALHTPDRGQGRCHRQRPGRQGPGHGDGHAGSCGCPVRPSPPMRRTRSRSRSARSGEVRASGAWLRRSVRAPVVAAGQGADDLLRARHRRAGVRRPRRRRSRRRWASSCCARPRPRWAFGTASTSSS